MTQLTKFEATQLHDALSHLTIADCTTELLSALFKLRHISSAPVLHTISITCARSDQRVACIKLIRSILNNGLKEAKDMLDAVTMTYGADGHLSFNIGGGTLSFHLTEDQIEAFRQSGSATNSELAIFDVKIDGAPFRI